MFSDSERLKNLDKILVIAVPAIGDFVYLVPFFKEISKRYPKLKIDLLLDETGGRKIRRFNWKKKLSQKDSVIDWLSSLNFFNKIYRIYTSKKVLKDVLSQARKQNYQQIFVLSWGRPHRHVCYARKISPKGFVIATDCKKYPRFNKMVDLVLNYSSFLLKKTGEWHISELFSSWFEQAFDLKLSKEQIKPFLSIPKKFQDDVKKSLVEWGVQNGEKTVFINAYSSNKSRNWPIENVLGLIKKLQKKPLLSDSCFVINMPPGINKEDVVFAQKNLPSNTFAFSANQNFFQLPAMLSISDLVISVDTSIIQLTPLLNTHLIALMRGDSEWRPPKLETKNIIFTQNRGRIKTLSVENVACCVEKFFSL